MGSIVVVCCLFSILRSSPFLFYFDPLLFQTPGGQILKDLQAEFNVKIYVEKDEQPDGTRLVVIHTPTAATSSSSSSSTAPVELSEAEADAMRRCKEKITMMVQALEQAASSSASATLSSSSSSASSSDAVAAGEEGAGGGEERVE